MKKAYIIGSLRNDRIPDIANAIRQEVGLDVFDDWFGAGPEADDKWQEYEQRRGRHYSEALYGHAASNITGFDKHHLDAADIGILVMPAGKSGHLEIGYMTGQGKFTYILMDGEPERWDVMYHLCTRVFFDVDSLIEELRRIA